MNPPLQAAKAVSEDDPNAQETRAYRVVAKRIEEIIRDEKIPAGGRLPSERELALRLDVGRALVREAMIALELSGIVEVRLGSGVYVNEKLHIAPSVNEAGSGSGPFEILSARKLIESEIAAVAARMATDSAIDAILTAVNDMERFYSDRKRNEEADRTFHLAVARATGNTAYVEVVECMWNQRGRLWSKMDEHFHTDELRHATLADHRRILEAIATRDSAGARRAMRAHLDRVTREFSRGWSLKDSVVPQSPDFPESSES
ncbi:FadR/GntR family transcriptional regulator [Herbaspirillum lusitanum]|jgi:DNA-binding FadR family transcriptional regulator|uniref:FadR/GntR family transcriptional regulator n=1 Tax=Herbaspirillum lusitanum TaxID=213312 RepID=A0ABW9A8C0_9BURK